MCAHTHVCINAHTHTNAQTHAHTHIHVGLRYTRWLPRIAQHKYWTYESCSLTCSLTGTMSGRQNSAKASLTNWYPTPCIAVYVNLIGQDAFWLLGRREKNFASERGHFQQNQRPHPCLYTPSSHLLLMHPQTSLKHPHIIPKSPIPTCWHCSPVEPPCSCSPPGRKDPPRGRSRRGPLSSTHLAKGQGASRYSWQFPCQGVEWSEDAETYNTIQFSFKMNFAEINRNGMGNVMRGLVVQWNLSKMVTV